MEHAAMPTLISHFDVENKFEHPEMVTLSAETDRD